jgi:hypothetical protein
MLQSKISKTKKRLSDTSWQLPLLVLPLLGLFAILTFVLRAATMPGQYGVVRAEMPVMSAPPLDPSFHNYLEAPSEGLSADTPMVVLTEEAFFFGDLAGFTRDLGGVRNKFQIKHVDGEPQLAELIRVMNEWNERRNRASGDSGGNTLVLLPTPGIPLPIVIQVMAGFRRSSRFGRVVLAGGLL